jgi:hypothetical protein
MLNGMSVVECAARMEVVVAEEIPLYGCSICLKFFYARDWLVARAESTVVNDVRRFPLI